jgi:hypothetical protein
MCSFRLVLLCLFIVLRHAMYTATCVWSGDEARISYIQLNCRGFNVFIKLLACRDHTDVLRVCLSGSVLRRFRTSFHPASVIDLLANTLLLNRLSSFRCVFRPLCGFQTSPGRIILCSLTPYFFHRLFCFGYNHGGVGNTPVVPRSSHGYGRCIGLADREERSLQRS